MVLGASHSCILDGRSLLFEISVDLLFPMDVAAVIFFPVKKKALMPSFLYDS